MLFLKQPWGQGLSFCIMEKTSASKRPAWNCFMDRAFIFNHVHCTTDLVFRFLFTQHVCKYKPTGSCRRPASVRTLSFWTLSTGNRQADYLPHILNQHWFSGSQIRWEAKLEMSGLMLGLVGNICLAFLFFPVSRGSSVLQLFGLTSEGSVKYHIWLGNIAMTLFAVHGFCYIIFWAKTDQISQVNNRIYDINYLELTNLLIAYHL